jgi:HTH-type transcriptional regulator/antitoxin HigA
MKTDPIDVIQFYIEQRGTINKNDLISILGDKTTVSKVMNRKRKLTLNMIRKLHDVAKIPYEDLMIDYELNI